MQTTVSRRPASLLHRMNSLAGRVTGLLLAIVAASIGLMSMIGYSQLEATMAENAAVRIDRAARAAAVIMARAGSEAEAEPFSIRRNPNGRPEAILLQGDPADVLVPTPAFDALVLEIGRTNQGAANLFRLNPNNAYFDRFATTFRKPDGSMPPPMSLKPGHPAYAALAGGSPHVGEVPVMGRMRLAYLTPILAPTGAVAGALAVDVGWVDDLVAARSTLRTEILIAAIVLLGAAGLIGVVMMQRELRPLKALSRFSNEVAAGTDDGRVPHQDRRDEIGALAQGLGRVVTLQDELETLAYDDALTGQGNRTRYLIDLERQVRLSRCERNAPASLLHLDLERFKAVNDAFGQTVGDVVLARVGATLREAAGPDARISRIAGDDFTIILPGIAEPDAVEAICERIVAAVSAPMLLSPAEMHGRDQHDSTEETGQGASARLDQSSEPGTEIALGCRVGIVLLPRDAQMPDEAHRNAELALRRAQAEGSTYVFFAESFNDAVQGRMRLERRLRTAIEEEALTVHLQPQVAADRSLFGVEALVRWPDADRGMIPPGEFIPLAESTGLIIDLGTFVLDRSCQLARTWLDEGFAFGHVSVNVSPVQLWQPRFVSQVAETLAKYGLDGRHLCLEVTEGVFVDHDEGHVASVLSSLRELGICLSLDDFGSGYSSLGYLDRMPFDQLKVDRSFVAGVHRDERKESLLRGVLALGKGLGLKIVVEGAEEAGEVALIQEIGCDAIQGFAYGRPVPAAQLPPEVRRIATERTAQAIDRAA
ncbi:MAG: EAL domain-containing protein [Pseudomonadota bacterium]